jgi:tRNA-splicing ligase RtcB
MRSIRTDNAPEQVVNVACLSGIQRASMAMPDIHWGYGFPIGGVAATDPEEGGIISPGGVGYDINCGVRIVRTDLKLKDAQPQIRQLVNNLFQHVPCGVGRSGKMKLSKDQERQVLVRGAKWIVQQGHGWPEDIDHTEAGGALEGADPDEVSPRAYERGRGQVGTLGAGNHFVEVQAVDEIYDEAAAQAFAIDKDSITVMIHSGSRGLGHQVCDDFLKRLRNVPQRYGITLPDRQLCCAPVNSPEGQAYLGAMRAAANYAWANRQLLLSLVRKAFAAVFHSEPRSLGMKLIYDVAHNIAKLEQYEVGGKMKTLCIHRKGATRAFPAGHPEIPSEYRAIGQPVIIPGDMGRCSYLLVGLPGAMSETFGSTCHGAGRAMSRGQARREAKGRNIAEELAAKGIVAKARGWAGLAEEQPAAYKDVTEVVDVVVKAGLCKKVCRLRPLGVIKG